MLISKVLHNFLSMYCDILKATIKWINLKKNILPKNPFHHLSKRDILSLLNVIVVKKLRNSTKQVFRTNIKISNKTQVLSICLKYFFKFIIFSDHSFNFCVLKDYLDLFE